MSYNSKYVCPKTVALSTFRRKSPNTGIPAKAYRNAEGKKVTPPATFLINADGEAVFNSTQKVYITEATLGLLEQLAAQMRNAGLVTKTANKALSVFVNTEAFHDLIRGQTAKMIALAQQGGERIEIENC